MDSSHELSVREAVARYVDASADGDTAAADAARAAVAELCVPAVRKAAMKIFKPADNDVDDLLSTAQLVFWEVLPDHLSRFDPSKVITLQSGKHGTFAGWVLYACPAWAGAIRREQARESAVAGVNVADLQMQRIYHGRRERFVSEHGRDWTSAEASQLVSEYLHETTRSKLLDRHPEWDEETLEAAVRNRITKDGHMRTLRELDEVVRLQDATRTASLDAPLAGGGDLTLGTTLAGELAARDEEPESFSDWARVATVGMGKRDRRVVAAHLDDPDRPIVEELLARARANLTDPVAQFVVLGNVEAQFEPEDAPRHQSVSVRAQLVSAANLV